jgi:hypothetical protein
LQTKTATAAAAHISANIAGFSRESRLPNATPANQVKPGS